MTALPIEPLAAPEPRWRVLRGANAGDRVYRSILTVLAITLPLLLLALVGELVVSAWPAIGRFGFHFLWTSVWDPVAGVEFGGRLTSFNFAPFGNNERSVSLKKFHAPIFFGSS